MIYAVASLTISNPEKLDAYRARAGEALAKHGGKVESASGALTVLDGAPELPNVAAVLSFPDKESAEAWANDPDLQEVHALRRSAGASNIFLMG